MKLVVFDMDGTLIDTQALIIGHAQSAFAALELPVPSEASVRSIIGLSLPVAIGKLLGTDDIDVIEGVVGQYKALYRSSLEAEEIDREPLYPGALAALDRLRAEPGTLLGIATGKGMSGVLRILDKHRIGEHFVTLQTPDDNPSKPHPGMLLRAMEQTGAASRDTVMIGDTTYDMELARAAGVAAIGVSWGYHDSADLLAAGAGALIHDYAELDDAIARVLE